MLPYEPFTCPNCGAQSWEEAYMCWLCRQRTLPVAATPPLTATLVPQSSEPGALAAALTGTSTIFTYLAAVVVGIGLTAILPVLGIAFGLFVMIPLITATTIRRRHKGKLPISWRQKVSNFFLGFAIVVALLIALAIAGGVAFLVNCVVNPQPFQIHP